MGSRDSVRGIKPLKGSICKNEASRPFISAPLWDIEREEYTDGATIRGSKRQSQKTACVMIMTEGMNADLMAAF